MKIIDTDNFGSDYPDEKFINLPRLSEKAAMAIARLINEDCSGPDARRFWKVVDDNYKLQPGFEP